MRELGEAPYRARQIADAIFRQRRESLERAPNLPSKLKLQLQERGFHVGLPKIEQRFTSLDGTVRYLMGLSDGESVETVWMPEGDLGEAGDGSEAGDEESADITRLAHVAEEQHPKQNTNTDLTDRTDKSFATSLLQKLNQIDHSKGKESHSQSNRPVEKYPSGPLNPLNPCSGSSAPGKRARSRSTICVSSQVGCAVNCQFCLTALLGVKRNLSPGEIVGQVLAVLRDHSVDLERERMNIVFMGMGEPFLNYENFMKAVRLLVQEVHFPESRMTVSTSGIVPHILDFSKEPIRPKLAISLNAPNDEIRERIMPITRKWNLEALLDAARQFALRPRERLTFEYVLLEGVNDAPEHAHELARRIADIRCKVNLIAFNPGPGVPYTMPTQERVLRFRSILTDAGVPAFIRRPRGRDIYAACGQLKRTVA